MRYKDTSRHFDIGISKRAISRADNSSQYQLGSWSSSSKNIRSRRISYRYLVATTVLSDYYICRMIRWEFDLFLSELMVTRGVTTQLHIT